MKELESKVQCKETELVNTDYPPAVAAERDALAAELEKLVHDRCLGAQVRSRAKWIEEAEKKYKILF